MYKIKLTDEQIKALNDLNEKILEKFKVKKELEDLKINDITNKSIYDKILNFLFEPNGDVKKYNIDNWISKSKDKIGIIEDESLKDELQKIFNYKSFQESKLCNNFYNILNLRICPYCGRNYIFTVVKNNNGKLIKPTIDHFLPKGKYPYLAIFPFNLIPSCYTCNSSCKKDEEIDFYPYSNEKDKYEEVIVFDRELKNTKEYEIKINTKYNKTVEVLKLKEIYNSHKTESDDLIEKIQIYNDVYSNNLETFGITKDDIISFILGKYKDDENESSLPLYKFIRDIADELKLLNKKKEE